nr:hypothetical protein Iba_chr13eCG9210 [Ipomoea batatas]
MEVGRPLPELVDEVFDRVRDILVNLCLYVVRGDSGEELRPVDVERSQSAVEGDGVPSTLDFGSLSLRAPIASGDGGRVARLSTGGGGSTTEDGSLLAQVGQGLHPLRDYAPSGGSLVRRSASIVGLIRLSRVNVVEFSPGRSRGRWLIKGEETNIERRKCPWIKRPTDGNTNGGLKVENFQ